MTELWLKFTDESGEPKRVLADKEKFVVGRHSESDLSVASGKLSREHIKIERFGDVFVVSDCASSNGTLLNDEDLAEPVSLKNGDKLNLGGGLEIEVEIVSDANGGADSTAKDEPENDAPDSAASAQNASASSGAGAIPTSFFYLAPVFGLLVLLVAGGLFFAFRGKDEPEIVTRRNDFIYSTDDTDSPKSNDKNNSKLTETPAVNSNGATPTPAPDSNSQPTPVISSETEKVKQTGALFLRRVALNDPNAFLTNKQAEILTPKINQLKNSPVLADQLKSAKANSAKIAELARSKNLKPEFLIAAALAKLGNERGDALAKSQAILETLAKLSNSIGNETANDPPVILAAFEQGEAGEFLKMRNMLQDLANKFPNSSVSIRSVWFLKENGKISDSQFELALRFLAVGTIMQNPKDFGINTEPVIF